MRLLERLRPLPLPQPLSPLLTHCPKLSYHFLAILPFLITKTNVNAMDSNSVTPYSYINFIMRHNLFPPEFQKVVFDINQIFLQNEADEGLAAKGVPFIQ